ncbi:hypothetical protein SAMN05216464_104178 [Mucilaginibacter pineti]|uniref:Uncharacterized protein n=1 Tax=Mucilaginibacter pineti TaxID=1391627 RepID=A0A1G7AQ95_9SPHI|nr:hypothetical protein SAMN05216464_104178 [Mucilaginibacter pineti]
MRSDYCCCSISTGHKIYQGITDFKHYWFDLVEGLGTIGVALFAPEVLVDTLCSQQEQI